MSGNLWPPRASQTWLIGGLLVTLLVAAGGAALVFRPAGSGAGGAGRLPLAQPDGRGQAAPEQVVRAWADAAGAGDVTTTAQLMGSTSGWSGDYWNERILYEHDHGYLGTYTITRLAATGASATAALRWTGAGARDLCLALQVGPDGTVTPLGDFHWCGDGE